METSNLHITEYRGNQDISFVDITSMKVQNHGEAVIDINSIAIYPGETVKLIEEDGTKCAFNLLASFSEQGKMPKFRLIYKKLTALAPIDNKRVIRDAIPYAVRLLNYKQGDEFEFTQNISGLVTLKRSFQSDSLANLNNGFENQFDIDLGFVEADTVVKYDRGGALDTHAIKFFNRTTAANSEIFMVNGNVMPLI